MNAPIPRDDAMRHAPGAAEGPGFAVYVHWPFCAAKCPYCDFNSHVRHKPVDQNRYLAALKREIAHMAALEPHRTVGSVFFGGGTPSLMDPAIVADIIETIDRTWSIEQGGEITLEANPTSVEAGRFRGYRAAGVNRVSLGVQALNDSDLRRLGRMHSAQEAMDAVKIAASTFERYSFDLIYARPDQTPATWAAELKQAIAMAVEHLSLYQLTIEPGTWFEKLHAAGKLKIPSADLGRELYDLTQEITSTAGLPAYEVSNHARAGAESRHNLVYWRYGDYAGVGAGAHGRLQTTAGRRGISTERHPETWLERVERDGHGIVEDEIITAEMAGDEFLVMGLRLTEGIDPKRFRSITGRDLDVARIADLVQHRMVETLPGGWIRVTPDGFPVLDAVVADLAA